MSKIEALEKLGFVPAFKGAQGGMLKERIEEAEAKRLAAENNGYAHPPEFDTWWGWDVFVPVSAAEARA